MRVLFVLNALSGGATMSAIDLMAALRKLGHRCFAVHPPGDASSLTHAVDGAAAVELPWWNRNYRATLWKRPIHSALGMVRSGFRLLTTRELERLIRRWGIDVVHTNTAMTLEGALAARLERLPHVWHIREQIGAGKLFRFWLPEPVLARTFTTLSSRIIANSHESRAFFDRNGAGGRVDVIYNGIPLDRFDDPPRAEELRKRWIGTGELLVGMVASLTSRVKKHDVFVEAASRSARDFPSARFVVVGSDPDVAGGFRGELEYARAQKQLARDLGLGQRIVWAGHQTDVPSVMGALDVLVHPCDGESFGRVAVEAMASRKPVVVADAGGLREIVEDRVTGLRVRPNDPDAFASGISALLADRAARESYGEAGRRRAEAVFSIDRAAGEVARVYERSVA
jgi:glycosyltransferase involved in cell wall biosynthesis